MAAISTVSRSLTTSIKIAEKVFEVIAVGEQSRSLLATIKQVNQQLESAKTLRRQKSGLLSQSEKSNIAETFTSTEEVLHHVARLVEKTRVDQQIHGGRIGLHNRIHFVLRDSPHIVSSSTVATHYIAPADVERLDGESHAARHCQSATQHDSHNTGQSSEPAHQR